MSARRHLLVVVVALAACAPNGLGHEAAPPRVARVERRTASVALDRISKRAPLLDGVDRHRGDGRGVTIYVFDGGIDSANAELRGRVRRGLNPYGDGATLCNAHGTAVASAAAGATLGVASRATVVDVKVIDCRTARGTVAAMLAAVQWTLQDHARHGGPAVANWSLLVDSTETASPIEVAIGRLRAAGILVVVSAGNVDRDACQLSPASSRRALVVGASSLVRTPRGTLQDERTKGTAWGECVDLYAPGDSVLLAGPQQRSAIHWTGTSMAAGFVSGAAAILLERYPAAHPDSVAAMLRGRGTPVVEDRAPAGSTRRSLLYIGSGP